MTILVEKDVKGQQRNNELIELMFTWDFQKTCKPCFLEIIINTYIVMV